MEVVISPKSDSKRIDDVEFGTPIKLLDNPDNRYLVLDNEAGIDIKYVTVANIKTGKIRKIPDETIVIIVDMVCTEAE